MNKKQISISLVIVALILALTVTVFAAENSVSLTLEASASNVRPGDKITVKVDLTENTGFAVSAFDIEYNAEGLKYISFEADKTFAKHTVNVKEGAEGKLGLAIAAVNPISGNVSEKGTVAILTFEVIEGYLGDAEIVISESAQGIMTNYENGMSTDFTVTGDKIILIGEEHKHTEVVDKGTEPTCTTTGKTEGKHCSVCNEVIVAQEEIPVKPHTEVVDKAIEATCTTTGKTEGKHCSVCNTVLVAQEEVPVKPHTEVVDKAVEATCTATGKTEGKHCSVCNTVLVAQEEVPVKPHTEVIDPAVDATCTATGKTEGKHCSVCNEVIVAQQEVPVKSHNYGDWTVIKEATTKEEGSSERTCADCGAKETRVDPMLEPSGIPTVVIIIIVVAVVGIAAAAVVYFVVIKPKKKA